MSGERETKRRRTNGVANLEFSSKRGEPTDDSSRSNHPPISDPAEEMTKNFASLSQFVPQTSRGKSSETPSGTHSSFTFAHKSPQDVDEEHADLMKMLVGRQMVEEKTNVSVMTRICPDTRDSQCFLDEHPGLFDQGKSRWVGIDKAAKTKRFSEEDLYPPLIEIIKAIQEHFGLYDHFTSLTARTEQSIKDTPDILLCYGPRTVESATLPFEPFNHDRIDCKGDDQLKWAVSCIDVKTGAFQKKDIIQVISYMKYVNCGDRISLFSNVRHRSTRRILLSQPGRRFVYSALVSEDKYELIVLDERGTLNSQAVDYHENPHDLVHLLLLLNGAYSTLNGFHEGLSRGANVLRVTRGDYKFDAQLPVAWPRLMMFGRCTEGMVASVADRRCFLKLSFLLRDKARLQKVIHTRLSREESDDGRCFVAKPFSDDAFWEDEDRPSRWRWAFSTECSSIQRLLVVQAYEAYDSDISQFQTLEELIYIYEDFTAGHEWLLIEQDIIHRDVSRYNIMRQWNPQRGRYIAILIDFDLASRFKERSLAPVESITVNNRTGTKLYMSVVVLYSEGTAPEVELPLHDHMDDLESGVWVLLDILLRKIPGQEKLCRRSRIMDEWASLSDRILSNTKQNILLRGDGSWHYQTHSKWQPVMKALLRSEFLRFFYDAASKKLDDIEGRQSPETPEEILEHAKGDYQKCRQLFRKALAGLGVDSLSQSKPAPECSPATPLLLPSHANSNNLGKTPGSRS
ncbi:hypothetical protein PQX77_012429 [Marasmius sp. AFHP31]|nr:hypothetical protein PQX77_012429 [Marasmius sp. AFHP31]